MAGARIYARRRDPNTPCQTELHMVGVGPRDKDGWFTFPITSDQNTLNYLINRYPDTEFKIIKPLDHKWREREHFRITSGHYPTLPKEWNKLTTITDHFAHLSADHQLVAYTENEEKGQKDIQNTIKAGKYIKRFYPDLSNDDIRIYSESIKANAGFKIAETDDEIYNVYINGPSSCMVKTDTFWPWYGKNKMPRHPCVVYNAGALKIAYLGSLQAVTARCLIWPEKKLYSRIYGAVDRMKISLERDGYKLITNNDNFDGAELRLIRYNSDYIIMPYIDYVTKLTYSEHKIFIGDVRKLYKKSTIINLDSRQMQQGVAVFADPDIELCSLTKRPLLKDYVVLDTEKKANRKAAIQAGYIECIDNLWSTTPRKIVIENQKTISTVSMKYPINDGYLKVNGVYRHRSTLRTCFVNNSIFVKSDKNIQYSDIWYKDLDVFFTLNPQLHPCPNYPEKLIVGNIKKAAIDFCAETELDREIVFNAFIALQMDEDVLRKRYKIKS